MNKQRFQRVLQKIKKLGKWGNWQLATLFLVGVASFTIAAFQVTSWLGFVALGLGMFAVEWRFSEE